jgi:hypothetical protein
MVRTSLNSFNLYSLRRGQRWEQEREEGQRDPSRLLRHCCHSCKHTLITQQDYLWHGRLLPSLCHLSPPLFSPFPPSSSLPSALTSQKLTYHCCTAFQRLSTLYKTRSCQSREAGRNPNLFLSDFPSTSPSTLSAHLLDSLQFPQCSSSSQSATGN